MNFIKLDSYHHGERGLVEHQEATLALGPPLRFVFRFMEHGRNHDVTLSQGVDGRMEGSIAFPGAGEALQLVTAVVRTEELGRWTISIDAKLAYDFVIHAAVRDGDEDQA